MTLASETHLTQMTIEQVELHQSTKPETISSWCSLKGDPTYLYAGPHSWLNTAREQRMHEQRRCIRQGVMYACQMGADNVNISDGLSTHDTLDMFWHKWHDPRDIADAMRHSNWLSGKWAWARKLTSLKEHVVTSVTLTWLCWQNLS